MSCAMEDELCYSTVIFNPLDKDKSAVPQSEELVLYAEVKRRPSPSEALPEISVSYGASNCSAASSPVSPAFRRAAVFLGLLCFLLISAVIAISIYNYIQKSTYNSILAQYNREKDVNLQLLAEKKELEEERARLMRLSEEMNGTLDNILHKSSFTAAQYCQSTATGIRCTSCPQHWIQKNSSCYFFYTGNAWKTWSMSQEYCSAHGAHLAMIDSEEEQEFINQYTKPYYDTYHGYWIGLAERAEKSWVWTNGAQLKRGFWRDRPYEKYMYCVLSMPSADPLRSWKSEGCRMENRWICEVEVLTWPTFLQAQQNYSDPST